MNQADLTVGQREVEKQAHARSESTGGALLPPLSCRTAPLLPARPVRCWVQQHLL